MHRGRLCRSPLVLLAALLTLAAIVPVDAAPSAREMYRKALAREETLRAAAQQGPPPLARLRAVAKEFEALVRRYPTSGYTDDALLRGAELSMLAYERYREARDRAHAVRLLEWLVREYPHSKYVKDASARIREIEAAAAPAVATAAVPVAEVDLVPLRGVSRTLLPDVERITVQLDAEVAYAEAQLANPSRLFFDLHGTSVSTALIETIQIFDDERVRQIRIGRHPNHVTRVVVELADATPYSVFPLYDPYRLVIDFPRPDAVSEPAAAPPAPAQDPTDRPVPQPGSAPPPLEGRPATPTALEVPAPPSVNSAGRFSLARQLGLGVSRIVIDPGHGGRDPGALGPGTSEADIVLDIALRLERLLSTDPSIDVVLTRRTDVYVPLEERTAIANRASADMFLSIHVNSSRNKLTRGVETYFLNFASNPEAEAVAARENSASGQVMRNLPNIVEAIALNNKLDESRDLAEIVQRAMVRRLRARTPELRNLGVKQAPFVVLIGAEMPSVLAEISFISNQADAKLLKTAAHRERLAEALFDAVTEYQRTLKATSTVASQ